MVNDGAWSSSDARVFANVPKPKRRGTASIPDAKPAAGFVAGFMTHGDVVDIQQVADAFGMSKGQLAETAGLATAALTKRARRNGPKAQRRMTEVLEIISRIREWAGGEVQAMAWYRSQPIPALDGRTPEALVKTGRAAAVRDYLDHLALGGFA